MAQPITDNSSLWQWSAQDLGLAIRRRDVSVVDVVAAAVKRLRSVNPALNAVTSDLGDLALKEASAQDILLSELKDVPELFGIPITIKQNIDQRGQSTNNGIVALADLIASDDAPVVKNAKDQGAVIIGRTNTPEFSLRYMTDNPLFGLTYNPWHADLTCGGSSGGAAAAVAMGIGAIAYGNDVGGSLRYPAYCCGVAAIKPTSGLVPAYNPSQKSERSPLVQMMSVQGPLARTVVDLRLALRAIAQPNAYDPLNVPITWEKPKINKPIRVALTYGVAGKPIHDGVKDAIDRAGIYLADQGYNIDYVDPPHMEEAGLLWRSLIMTEAKTILSPAIQMMAGDDFKKIMEYCYSSTDILDLTGYMNGLMRRFAIIRDWKVFHETYPVIIAPVSYQPPFTARADTESAETMRTMFDAQIPLGVVNLLGFPAATLPVCPGDTVPWGVQVITAPFQEALCLDVAEDIERSAGNLLSALWEK